MRYLRSIHTPLVFNRYERCRRAKYHYKRKRAMLKSIALFLLCFSHPFRPLACRSISSITISKISPRLAQYSKTCQGSLVWKWIFISLLSPTASRQSPAKWLVKYSLMAFSSKFSPSISSWVSDLNSVFRSPHLSASAVVTGLPSASDRGVKPPP